MARDAQMATLRLIDEAQPSMRCLLKVATDACFQTAE
jgi:hypothetical protein